MTFDGCVSYQNMYTDHMTVHVVVIDVFRSIRCYYYRNLYKYLFGFVISLNVHSFFKCFSMLYCLGQWNASEPVCNKRSVSSGLTG